MKLVDIGQERGVRHHGGCAMGMGQFLSLLRNALLVDLREMRMEQIQEVLQAATELSLYCQNHEQVDHMFCCVSVNKRLSPRYVNRAIYCKRIWSRVQVKNLRWLSEFRIPFHFNPNCTPMH